MVLRRNVGEIRKITKQRSIQNKQIWQYRRNKRLSKLYKIGKSKKNINDIQRIKEILKRHNPKIRAYAFNVDIGEIETNNKKLGRIGKYAKQTRLDE